MFNNFGQNMSYQVPSSYSIIANQQAQQMQNTQQREFQPNTNMTFVNGIEGAKGFQLSPNSSVLLLDADNPKFYVKSTDNFGIAKLVSYTFSEEVISQTQTPTQAQTDNTEYLKVKDFEEFSKKFDELTSQVDALGKKLSEVL